MQCHAIVHANDWFFHTTLTLSRTNGVESSRPSTEEAVHWSLSAKVTHACKSSKIGATKQRLS